jgi:AcrR family transcriptional regulator
MDGEVHQLPRGRHRLSREEVLASQRGRMLTAVAEAVAEKGFARVSVADIIKRAGVSRETFYEQFADKEACFMAALDAGAEAMLGGLRPALEPGERTPLHRLDSLLRAYLEVLSEEPAFAQAYLIGAYGAGPAATARRLELQQGFVNLVTHLLGATGEADRFAAEAIVAAISSLVTVRVGTGHAADLPELRQPLLELAVRLFPALASETPITRARRRATR